MHSSFALWEYISARCGNFQDQQALVFGSRGLTFSDLTREASLAIPVFERAGIRAGSLVLHAFPNGPAFTPALMALWQRDAVVGFVSPKYQASEFAALRKGLKPEFALTTTPLAEELAGHLQGTVTVRILLGGEEVAIISANSTEPRSWSEQPAIIKLTSGSTGEPKAIPLSAENLIAEATNVSETLQISSRDRILAPVPLFHSYGFDIGLLPMLTAGATLVVQDQFIPRRVMTELAQPDTSIWLGVPSMYRALVETPFSSIPALGQIRYLLSCTAPLSEELIGAFHDKFGVPICQHYGSSETGAVTNHVPSAVLQRKSSVGRALANVIVRIVSPDGSPLPSGQEGEVVVRSGVVASRYLLGAPEGQSPLRDGRYYTGDLGVLDTDGFLHLKGRLNQLINVGGLKVSPQEVAQVLEGHSAVREAAVVGAINPLGEEVVYALVTLRATATEMDLYAYCRVQLADYKVPKRIDIRDELPRGAAGKLRIRPEDLRW